MRVHFSESESNYLGIRVGRARLEKLTNSSDFRKEILRQELDVVKIKVNALQENIFPDLDKIGFPYFVNSILYRNKVDYTNSTPASLPQGFSYEPYAKQQRSVFKKMLEEIFDHTTGINYTHPLYGLLVNKKTEKSMAVDYYLQFDSEHSPEKTVWLLKKGSAYIGFVCGQFQSYGFEGIWYGVLPKFRTKGLSSLLIDVVQIECYKRKVNYFFNDVQYQNIFSQLNVMKNGATPVGSYLNIFLLPNVSLTKLKGKSTNNSNSLTVKELIDVLSKKHPANVSCHTRLWIQSKKKPTHYVFYKIGKKNGFGIFGFYLQSQLIAQYFVLE